MRSAVFCLALVCALSLFAAPSHGALSSLSASLPSMPASVSHAVAQPHDDTSTLGHTDDDLFFLQLSQHVDNLAQLEAEAEHEVEMEAQGGMEADMAAMLEAEMETETEAGAEMQSMTEADIDAEDAALAEVEGDLYAEAPQSHSAAPVDHAEAEMMNDAEFGNLLELEAEDMAHAHELDNEYAGSGMVLLELEADLAADSEADATALLEAEASVDAEADVDVILDLNSETESDDSELVVAALEDNLNLEGEIDASKHPNPQSLFRPRILPNRRLNARSSEAAQMKAWMQRIDRAMPKIAAMAEPDDGFTTVA